MDRVKISKLTIKIGGKTITISTNEAKELKEALDEIFPAHVEPVQITWHHEPYLMPEIKYPPHWQFGAEQGTGGSITCDATLDVGSKGRIIT